MTAVIEKLLQQVNSSDFDGIRKISAKNQNDFIKYTNYRRIPEKYIRTI